MAQQDPRIAEFLRANNVGVLATSDLANHPHAATMYFVVEPDLSVYFITKEETTKCHDLEQNPRAALAVYEASTQTTVQMNGTVTPVEDASLIEDVYRRVLATVAATSESAVPPLSRISGGKYKFFCFKPQRVRLAQYAKPAQAGFDSLFDEVVLALPSPAKPETNPR